MYRRVLSALFFSFSFFVTAYSQVQLQTGSATYSVPMFNWQDDKSSLKTFVSIVYSSGNGLKVNEVASNIGQGWNLIAGGVITRMQVGEPDDQPAYAGSSAEDIKRYPAGFLYAQRPAGLGYPQNLKKYPIYRNKNQPYAQRNDVAEDKQLDYFYFQFNGQAGVFVIDTLNEDRGVALNDERIKITFQHNSNISYQGKSVRTTIESFTIQDVDGLKYKFSTLGISKILKVKYTDRNFQYPAEQPKFKNNKVYYQSAFSEDVYTHKPWIVSSWYLTEIEDPLTQRKITFTYVPTLVDNHAGDDIQYMRGKKEYAIVTRKKMYGYTQEIASATMPDGHTVDFVYTGSQRLDYSSYKALEAVDIKYNSRYLSKYKLRTSYFILRRFGTPVTEEQKRLSRLCLMSVQKFGVDLKEEAPPHKFDYYVGSDADDDVVAPYFSFLKDNWGYYNGFNSKGFTDAVHILWHTIAVSNKVNIDAQSVNYNQAKGLCYLQSNLSGDQVYINPKTGYAKNGLLKQVILPTGGTIKYNYEQNKQTVSAAQVEVGGVRVSSTEATDGGYTNNCDNPLKTYYQYVEDQPSEVSSIWGVETPVHSVNTSSFYAPESKFYQWNPFKSGLFGACDYRFKYPGIQFADQGISLSFFQQMMNVITPVLSIVSNVMTVMNAITVFTGGGGGITLAIDIAVNLIGLAISCIGDQAKTSDNKLFFSYDLNAVNPLPTQYKRVVVVEGGGANGKTIHQFTNTDHLPYLSEPNPTYSNKQRYLSWAYGLPKKITFKNNLGNTVREIENNYSFEWYQIGDLGHGTNVMESAKFKVNKSYSQRNTDWASSSLTTNNQSTSDVELEIYRISFGQARLTSSIERNFDSNTPANYSESTTYYQYNSMVGDRERNSEVSSIMTENSEGYSVTKEFTYSDYYTGGVYDVMKQNHILSLPVTETVKQYKGSPSPVHSILSEKKIDYTQITAGNIKPLQILEKRYKAPEAQYGGTHPAFLTTSTYTYGPNSKILGIVSEGDRKVKYVYDYNDKYVVAEVANVNPGSRILYTSFENSNYLGEWTIAGTNSFTTANDVTGSKVFTLTPGQNSISGTNLYDNATNPYRLSFWASASSFTFSSGGATLISSGPVKNGYTYYEYQLTPSTTTITIAANGSVNVNIDELRCYPMNARMITTTYDPLIGKTSECDANNRITYYEYDNLGRMQFVKDADKNIVKAYEYNNVSDLKLGGCPQIYYNRKISEDFKKSNCSSGYEGGLITYTINAGTYSSTISQEDADVKAEQQLLLSGQAAANSNNGTGACLQLFYNTAVSRTDSSEVCGPGYIPGPVTYTVPANKYSSTISQADADEQAQDDLDANSQDYANKNPNCTYSTSPFWETVYPEQTECVIVDGQAHIFYLAFDTNPNSSTYNQSSMKDGGPSNCTPPTIYVRLSYENYSSNMYEEYADVVVRFYSDAAGTIPVNISGLNLNYNGDYTFWDDYSSSYGETTYNYYAAPSGTEYVLAYNALLTYYDSNYTVTEMWNYYLIPGSGYTIIY